MCESFWGRRLGKYEVIYADPPWSYKQNGGPKGKRGVASAHYSCMELDELSALPVKELAACSGCALFMWATGPMLKEALSLMSAWGFQYKGIAFTWVKTNRKTPSLFWGMGSYTRANSELCLVGVTPGYKATEHVKSHSVHQIVQSKVRRHSEKPPEVRDRITELLGDVPRIELFARQRVDGWDSWGDEI